MDYFTLNKLFTYQQYRYRTNRSSELAALELIDRNIVNMNRNLTPVNVYINLSKAFDSLDHNILLSKLKFYGLSDDASVIRLLKKYLSNQKQLICATWKHKISTSWHLTWNSSRFDNGPTPV